MGLKIGISKIRFNLKYHELLKGAPGYMYLCTQLVSFEITYVHEATIEERPLNKSGYYCQVSSI